MTFTKKIRVQSAIPGMAVKTSEVFNLRKEVADLKQSRIKLKMLVYALKFDVYALIDNHQCACGAVKERDQQGRRKRKRKQTTSRTLLKAGTANQRE